MMEYDESDVWMDGGDYLLLRRLISINEWHSNEDN